MKHIILPALALTIELFLLYLLLRGQGVKDMRIEGDEDEFKDSAPLEMKMNNL